MMQAPFFNIKYISKYNDIIISAKGYNTEVFRPYVINGRIRLINIVRPKAPPPITNSTQRFTKNCIAFNASTDNESSVSDISNGCSSSIDGSSGYDSGSSDLSNKNKSSLEEKGSSGNNSASTDSSSNYSIENIRASKTIDESGNLFDSSSRDEIVQTPLRNLNNSSKLLNGSRHSMSRLALLNRTRMRNSYKSLSQNYHSSLNITPDIENCSTSTPVCLKRIRKIPTPQTVINWRKCITPVKTYAKRKLITRPESVERLKQYTLPWKRYFELRRNATQGYLGDAFIKVVKIGKIMDARTRISNAGIRKNLTDYSDIIQQRKLDTSKFNSNLHKCESDVLLSTSNRDKCCAKNLKNLFEKKCATITCPVDKEFENCGFQLPLLELSYD